MNITIKKQSKVKSLINAIKDKLSSLYLYSVTYIAVLIRPLQPYSERLMSKKIKRLQHQIVKMKWEVNTLNKALTDINSNKESTTD